jgi:hypothetical protein
MEWNDDNNVNANISLAQFSVFTALVVPACFPHFKQKYFGEMKNKEKSFF